MEHKLIEKENISTLNFISYDVINDESKKTLRNNLKLAERLGNGYKRKSKISFKSSEGLFKVETTVWSSNEKFITLKGGVSIPINCIDSISFY